MKENKTQATDQSVEDFLNSITDEKTRQDCQTIAQLMQSIAGEPPKMWGTAIVGFGLYDYKYASGRQGQWFKFGFAPRKKNISLHFIQYLENQPDILARLGKHSAGKGCLYIKRLSDIDTEVLQELIKINNA